MVQFIVLCLIGSSLVMWYSELALPWVLCWYTCSLLCKPPLSNLVNCLLFSSSVSLWWTPSLPRGWLSLSSRSVLWRRHTTRALSTPWEQTGKVGRQEAGGRRRGRFFNVTSSELRAAWSMTADWTLNMVKLKIAQLKIEHCTPNQSTCTICSKCIHSVVWAQVPSLLFLFPFPPSSSLILLPPSSRIRLRKKTWRTAGTIYLNHQVFEKDIHVFAHFEMYVEPLEGQFVLQKVRPVSS